MTTHPSLVSSHLEAIQGTVRQPSRKATEGSSLTKGQHGNRTATSREARRMKKKKKAIHLREGWEHNMQIPRGHGDWP